MDQTADDGVAVLAHLLEAAAGLQQLVPDAVLVAESGPLLDGHPDELFDHDHVVTDLRDRFDAVLEALESEGEWVTNRVTFGKIILGQLGDIEAGVRQLIRRTRWRSPSTRYRRGECCGCRR